MAKGLKVKIAEFFPSQELTPEGEVIEKMADLLRGKELEILQLVLKVAKVISSSHS